MLSTTPHHSADELALLVMGLTLMALLGPILMPVLRKVGTAINWVLWRVILIAIDFVRDEIIKAILAAIAASTGLAGLIHFFS